MSEGLGVNITSEPSWIFQVNDCANKANRFVGFLKRTVSQRNNKLVFKLYMSLVRPIFEYCVLVWSLYLKKDISSLKKVQRRASKCAVRLNFDQKIDYEDRLELLKWPTLEKRRLMLSLIVLQDNTWNKWIGSNKLFGVC